MSVDSLREEQLSSEVRAFAELRQGPVYDPEAEVYAIDDANNPHLRLLESVKSGATMDLSLVCADGRREFLKLDVPESRAWSNASFEDRTAFANDKIRERRATVALNAARRLQERALSPSETTVTPEEDAALREFGLLEETLEPKAEGGYDKSVRLAESRIRRIRLKEDGFWDGAFDDAAGYNYSAPTQREYLPRGGPSGQQQLISDRWDELAKAYYAWTHDPVIRAACELLTDFILGRGVTITATDKRVQPIIDEYMEREQVNERLHTTSVSLSRDGNVFTREFRLGDGRLKHRNLPAESIWEIITDAEDPLDVFLYVQRYQTRYQQFVPAGFVPAQQKWIERTIPADELYHLKINAKESDVFGRGDVYPALGWAKRLRDYFDAIIQKEYAAAAYQWDYKINGGQGDIDRIMQNVIPAARPVPGSYFAHNDQVEVAAVASSVRAVSQQGGAYDSLLNHIALAFVLSKSYFGVSDHQNRASALVATEPTAKHLETRQDLINSYLSRLIRNVIKEARAFGLIDAGVKDFSFHCVFPSIIKADSQARVAMLRQAESSFYISRRTAAEATAGEVEIDDYDFGEEMKQIEIEIGENPLRLTARDLAPVKRGLPGPGDVAFDPGEVPNPSTQPAPVKPPAKADAGDASPTSATGAAKVRDELGRGGKEDRSTTESDRPMSDEQFREACKARGVIVITP